MYDKSDTILEEHSKSNKSKLSRVYIIIAWDFTWKQIILPGADDHVLELISGIQTLQGFVPLMSPDA